LVTFMGSPLVGCCPMVSMVHVPSVNVTFSL
jgi:hypothetical protein